MLTVGGVDTADNAVLDPGTNHIVEIDDAVGAPTRYRIHRAGGDVTEEQYVGGDTFDYYYDGHKRVVDVQKNGSDVGQYGYDDAGRRVWRQTFGTGAATTLYVFDPQGHLLAEHDDATGNPLKEYVWIDDLPVAVVDYTSGSAATYYIHTGQMDEPLVLTNASKAKVWDAYVNPWGKAQTFTAASAFIDLRLPGQWLQLEANGLHQNGMRDYDPSLGRYVQADPLGLAAGENVYAYADDDPLNLADPNGLLDFKYYGNWGGPGWASGAFRPESGPLPSPGDKDWRAPIDRQDTCYMGHDMCIHNLNMCPLHGNPQMHQCDADLLQCLADVRHQSLVPSIKSSIARGAFKTVVPLFFH